MARTNAAHAFEFVDCLELREMLGYSSLSLWMNSGGQVPHERVMRSMRLFAEKVIPKV